MQVPHVQRQTLAPGAHLGLVLMSLACLALAVAVDEAITRAGTLAMAAFLLLLLLNFQHLRVVVSAESLRVGFPIFNSTLPLKDLRSVEILPRSSIWARGGFGCRFSLQGELCYLARSGPALRLRAHSRRLPVLFTCDRPAEVVAALRQAGCSLPLEESS